MLPTFVAAEYVATHIYRYAFKYFRGQQFPLTHMHIYLFVYLFIYIRKRVVKPALGQITLSVGLLSNWTLSRLYSDPQSEVLSGNKKIMPKLHFFYQSLPEENGPNIHSDSLSRVMFKLYC